MVSAGVLKLENRPDCIYFGAAGHVLGTGHTLRREFTAYAQPQATGMADPFSRRGSAQCADRPMRRRRPGSTARRNGSPVCCWPAATGRSSRRPTSSSSTRPAAPGCRPGWSSGDTHDRRRRPSTSESAMPHSNCGSRTGCSPRRWSSRGVPHRTGRPGHMLCYEDRTWALTTFTVRRRAPRTSPDPRCRFGDSAPEPCGGDRRGRATGRGGVPPLPGQPVAALRQAAPLSRGIVGGRLGGDFNPTYGQGMTMSSIQAGHLRRVASGTTELAGSSTGPPRRRRIRCGR